MTIIEKILASHSKLTSVKPGDIVDIEIDARVARDFGGANVVKIIKERNLGIENPSRTFFTFDCNPTGSDQKYAVNQHICRLFARENGIKVYDIDAGIGTHILIDDGIVGPGSTAVSTDSHANILGAVGAFGQGMGDMDIAAAWSKGKVWFKIPETVRINLSGELLPEVTSKDVALNLLKIFGADSLLGKAVEVYGKASQAFTIDERITIASMATEMGAIIILFPPSDEVIGYCSSRAGFSFTPVYADADANYYGTYEINVSDFKPLVSLPGQPHDTIGVSVLYGIKIDSAFIGSCTNGRLNDMRSAAAILKGNKVAPGVVLKIVPSTDSVWRDCLAEGLIRIFKDAGALISNAGCAGCAAGQVGQNGPGEVTISSGNRNFPGKQGKGSVYLASPSVVAASAIAGFITTPDRLPVKPAEFPAPQPQSVNVAKDSYASDPAIVKPVTIEGRIWNIRMDNIDTDMIYHNRYLTVTDIREMGQYTFGNLKGYEDFYLKATAGDIIVTGKNFGAGSSRQQAVDCFISLGINAIVAESFGAIYERNAINAAFPVITCNKIKELDLSDGDTIRIDFISGRIECTGKNREVYGEPFPEVQLEIYRRGGLL